MYKTRDQLAKFAIKYYLENHALPSISGNLVSNNLKNKIPCFVTVFVNKELRGCIGNYETDEPLYINIIKNAINASFFDNRFYPVTDQDLPKLKVEISCLSTLKDYHPKNITSLLDHLTTSHPGLLISSGFHQALFLPQVWDELPKPEDFLSHLCLKAGLPPNYWQSFTNLCFKKFRVF
jgi:AmmeMemoRadiSam system protein A